jgi:hypothetical protein
LDLEPEQIPHLDVPLHTVIKLSPKVAITLNSPRYFLLSDPLIHCVLIKAYGCEENRYVLAPVAATTDNKVEQSLT